MKIKDWPVNERPREKLLLQGPALLSNAELLAIFLRTGSRGKTAVDLARELLKKFGNLNRLLNAKEKKCYQIRGLGPSKYAQLKAALEIGKRLWQEKLEDDVVISNSHTTKFFLKSRLSHYQHEVFACIFLNTQLRTINYTELFHGTIDNNRLYIRTLLKRALEENAAAVILAHNHPSGIPEPSQADIAVTKQLIQVLGWVDIRVIDHLVIGTNEVFSFAEKGLLFPQ